MKDIILQTITTGCLDFCWEIVMWVSYQCLGCLHLGLSFSSGLKLGLVAEGYSAPVSEIPSNTANALVSVHSKWLVRDIHRLKFIFYFIYKWFLLLSLLSRLYDQSLIMKKGGGVWGLISRSFCSPVLSFLQLDHYLFALGSGFMQPHQKC